MSAYQGYCDIATRESLSLLAAGARYGYASDELGGAARIAPVLFSIDDPDAALAAAVDQSRLTHRKRRLPVWHSSLSDIHAE